MLNALSLVIDGGRTQKVSSVPAITQTDSLPIFFLAITPARCKR